MIIIYIKMENVEIFEFDELHLLTFQTPIFTA